MPIYAGWRGLCEAEKAHEVPYGGYCMALGVSGDLWDFWMPDYIALHPELARQKEPGPDHEGPDQWCRDHCAGTWRRVFSGVYEFAALADAEAFLGAHDPTAGLSIRGPEAAPTAQA